MGIILQGSMPFITLSLRGSLRGAVNCPLGHKLHSDVNGALNMMKLGIKKVINILKKSLSFLVTPNGVIAIKGSNTLDLGGTLAP
ncbi:hypothetical protein GWK48_10960 [Metallosphaera tengchongensis]|uniref:Uncharacterized protein n=1 Tax=Metallosphaera tengchongensis TaxID=1532350 RepID=A0A6N0NVR7_9CREN|nr:hypothetical protein [Metallosphaera tengchongensis]QKR00832.1 hypothetical protein GWK48_10960 [Metallosphaera tengchongensis]